ncbi:uncharacterized protein LOC108866630 [Pyrus x bretschneideri]|uniref:uncharacterized protein LOC108866630 n=1 Tax=Pyrus x bretschneideri TaxID=225117 RepID=UPI002030C169|nr:uncharacterized protein LOC108866630 [Pyrus x bretschneideri]
MAQLLLQRRKKSQLKAQMRVAMIRKMMMKPLQRLLRKKPAQLQRKAHQWLLKRQTLAAMDLKRALNLKMSTQSNKKLPDKQQTTIPSGSCARGRTHKSLPEHPPYYQLDFG